MKQQYKAYAEEATQIEQMLEKDIDSHKTFFENPKPFHYGLAKLYSNKKQLIMDLKENDMVSGGDYKRLEKAKRYIEWANLKGSYYSGNADIRGNSDFDVNLIAEDQKIKFKNISYSTDSDGALSFGVEGNTDEEVSVSVSSDRTSFSINNSGELEGSATMKVGKDTYTVKDKMSLEEVSFEESIKTEDEVGSITSTIGIKRKNDNGWTPLPVPAVEPEPIQLPQFEAPDINWGYVAAGVAVGVIIAGAIVLAPETGGASLVALAVV